MGLFGKLLSDSNGSSFEERYGRLKALASQIMPYEHAGIEHAGKADVLIPLCNEFVSIAGSIDRNMALRRFRSEAKAAEPKTVYPYHPLFHSCAFGKNDDFDRIVTTVKGIGARFSTWQQGIARTTQKLVGIPLAPITLSEENVLRNKMITMPDIKYSSVGKSFNKDKLVRFVVIDTETTGLKASSGRIVQLSAIKYADWEPVEKWNTHIDPGKVQIEPEASKKNGLTNEMLKGQPTIKQVAASFTEFVGDCAVVGYNLPFDLKFLYAEGIDLTETKRKYFDVLELSKKAFKGDLDSFSLAAVATYNGIYYKAHNALYDCLATGDIFIRVIDEITSG